MLATRSLRLTEQWVFSRDFTVEPYKQIDDRMIQCDAHQGNSTRVAGSVLGIGGGGRKTKSRMFKNAEEFAERILEGGMFQAGTAELSRDRSEKLSGLSGGPVNKLGIARATTGKINK